MTTFIHNKGMKNRERLLKLLDILRRDSDDAHPLSLETIAHLLDCEGVYRKTLNEDIRVLERYYPQYAFNYRHKHGYSLNEAPFTLAEIKILIDALDSLKTIDDSFAEKTKDKLFSFISVYQRRKMEELSLPSTHEGNHFLYHFEILLDALFKKESVQIKRTGKVIEEIVPLFFDRVHDRYYLLYQYPHKKRIYRLRFENIENVFPSNQNILPDFSEEEIHKYILRASDAYHSNTESTLTIRLIDDNPKLRNYLCDDFPSISFYANHIALLDGDLNDRFFAKLFAYQDRIQILKPESARQAYEEKLKKTLETLK